MKKIIALLIIFVMTFTSGYAITDKTVNLTTYDLLKTNIFYINGQGYTKVDGKLKKVEGIKFYSINGKRYIKENGRIKQVNESNIKKVNGVNYVITGDELVKLDKYLLENPVKEEKKTFSDIFKIDKKENLQLDYLYEYKLNEFQKKALDSVIKTIEDKYPQNLSSLKLLKEGKFNTTQIEKIRNYYFNLGDIELSKNLNVLKNISQINIKEVNYAIKKKLNNEKITFRKNNNNNIEEDFNINIKENTFTENPETDLIDNNGITNIDSPNTSNNEIVEEEIDNLFGDIFGDL